MLLSNLNEFAKDVAGRMILLTTTGFFDDPTLTICDKLKADTFSDTGYYDNFLSFFLLEFFGNESP